MEKQRQSFRNILTLALFLIVIGLTLGISITVLPIQQNDAAIINLSGRQRMLIQKFTKEVFDKAYNSLIELRESEPGDRAEDFEEPQVQVNPAQEDGRKSDGDYSKEVIGTRTAIYNLDRTRKLFESTLHALRFGGAVYTDLMMTQTSSIIATSNQQILDNLSRVHDHWEGMLSAVNYLLGEEIQIASFRQEIANIRRLNIDLLVEMDQIVQMFQEDSESRTVFLTSVQYMGGAGSIALFVWLVLTFRAERAFRQVHNELRIKEEALRQQHDQLETANKEMEAFAYTLTHDLKTPLRQINDFSNLILEDYGDRLGTEGRDCFESILTIEKRMGLLINDILKLSLINRGNLEREDLDLSALVNEIANTLRTHEPERVVEFIIADSVTARGDPNLTRVVLENLLGNAWKFTQYREKTEIKFGVDSSELKPVYYVKDNGAGFDKSQTDDLFTPFMRLQTEQEFAGTDIGLATVKKIVLRHGGTVWAEGVKNEGASFYFTLG